MQIQSNLASTIAMAFDECAPSKADRKYVQNSVDRTTRWLVRCKEKMAELNSRKIQLINISCSLASIRELFTMISGKVMRMPFGIWIWMVMQWADWQWENLIRRCTMCWRK